MEQTNPRIESLPSLALWWALLAGPVVWIVHFTASYLVVEAACEMPIAINTRGLNPLAAIIVILTGIAILVTLYTGIQNYRLWRGVGSTEGSDEEGRQDYRWTAHGWGQFMVFVGMLLSFFFAIIILLTAVPMLLLRPC